MDTKDAGIPPEIKRFNWGAFLLNGFWAIHHGVWLGLLIVIPVFGWLVMPFILGLKGNVWAWKKGNYLSADKFLRAQRRWSIAAFVFCLLIISSFVALFFSLSAPIRMSIRTVKNNDRLIEYFGSPVVTHFNLIGQFDQPAIRFSKTLGMSAEFTVKLDTKGPKNHGAVFIKIMHLEGFWFVKELSINNPHIQEKTIIHPTLTCSGMSSSNCYIDELNDILGNLTLDPDSFFIFSRSESLNDFMQTGVDHIEDGNKCFIVEYSHGYSNKNKNSNLYQSPGCTFDKSLVLNLFREYASGRDGFKTKIQWAKLENK